jgi:tetratricopeptide (TPR) repeat protein
VRFAAKLQWILVAGFIVVILAASFAHDHIGGPSPIIVLVLLGALNWFVVRRYAWNWLWRRSFARLQRAVARDDRSGAERLLRRQALEAPTPAVRAWVAHMSAALLTLDERWRDAVTALRAIDRDALGPREQLMLDNSLAWALTHDGALDDAVALARTTAERARADAALGAVSRGACIGTLGVTLTRAGMHEPALALLREALALGGSPRLQVARYFYIGEAERARGHADAAQAAYAEAARIAPGLGFGRRAAERLNSASAMPYR